MCTQVDTISPNLTKSWYGLSDVWERCHPRKRGRFYGIVHVSEILDSRNPLGCPSAPANCRAGARGTCGGKPSASLVQAWVGAWHSPCRQSSSELGGRRWGSRQQPRVPARAIRRVVAHAIGASHSDPSTGNSTSSTSHWQLALGPVAAKPTTDAVMVQGPAVGGAGRQRGK